MITHTQFWVCAMQVRYTDRWETLVGNTWRVADPEIKEVIRDHLSEHCAADNYPSADACLALRPAESSELRLVDVDTNELTPAHWLTRANEVADAVNGLGVSGARLTVDGGHWTLTISTGGWSECEALLGELHTGYQRGDLFWMLFWESSHRGGRHVFRCDLGKGGGS